MSDEMNKKDNIKPDTWSVMTSMVRFNSTHLIGLMSIENRGCIVHILNFYYSDKVI